MCEKESISLFECLELFSVEAGESLSQKTSVVQEWKLGDTSDEQIDVLRVSEGEQEKEAIYFHVGSTSERHICF